MQESTISNPSTLARRPVAEARAIDALVQDVLQGKVRIPGWQRPLKWEVEDARKLLDSLYRGYPVGTLLFWKREGPSEEISFGTVHVHAEGRSDALYVVDGQQRITTLVRVLTGGGSPAEPFALFFDLDHRKIVQPPRDGPDVRWLPLTEILDSRRLVKWLLAHPEADQDAAIDLGARIREYAVPAYIVESDDEQAVRDIFERTNDTGKRLDANEVFDGRFRGLDEAEPRGLRDVAVALVDVGFGRLNDEQLHTMMLAVRFTDLTKGDTSSWSPAEARAALIDLQSAARRVLSFLLDDAAIPHLRYLPYAQPLLTLTRFFHFHPDPHPRNRMLLARWVWRGASAGLHGGASVGTRATLKAIDERNEDLSVQRLLQLVEEGRSAIPFDPSADHFRLRDAKAKIGALALAELEPRHLLTGEAIELGTAQPLQVTGQGERKSSLGNRVLHTPLPGGLRRAIVGCRSDDVLASHDIEAGDRTLLRSAPDLFIERREARLVQRVEALVRRHTLWSDSDRPPLRALLDEEVDD